MLKIIDNTIKKYYTLTSKTMLNDPGEYLLSVSEYSKNNVDSRLEHNI